ncbi:MAG: exodeoxyribonuclease [Solirubrobacteraceae bacterium]|jgi:exonuclease III|nr:exodeoxyribonuclease [Solirubrobacteraceae bacterium]
MRVLTWNVAGRVKRRAEQVAAVLDVDADVVALQEVTPTTAAGWTQDLERAGYEVVTTGAGPRPEGRRRLGVLTGARGGLERRSPESGGPPEAGSDLPWPERLVVVETSGAEVWNLHSPIAPSPGLAKVRTHEAVHAALAAAAGARILAGDLNTPRRESPEGDVMTFARDSKGRLRPERGERWDRAELALVKGLEAHGWRDAFRAVHGYGRKEVSWAWPHGGGWRLDHVLVSPEVEPVAAEYLHDLRLSGLSDHSALVAQLAV